MTDFSPVTIAHITLPRNVIRIWYSDEFIFSDANWRMIRNGSKADREWFGPRSKDLAADMVKAFQAVYLP